jgi:hypothetical protein
VRTKEKLDIILESLQANCGDEFMAARDAGLSLLFLRQWCKDDADVSLAVAEAKTAGFAGLYTEAVRRAVKGVEKGVYYQGEEVARETVYSDGLLTKIMAAKLPEFAQGEGGGPGTAIQINGGQVNIMPRAASYDEWLRMKESTLNRSLPAPEPLLPDNSELAEFTEVVTENPFAHIPL